jgi:hypothetical protein
MTIDRGKLGEAPALDEVQRQWRGTKQGGGVAEGAPWWPEIEEDGAMEAAMTWGGRSHVD